MKLSEITRSQSQFSQPSHHGVIWVPESMYQCLYHGFYNTNISREIVVIKGSVSIPMKSMTMNGPITLAYPIMEFPEVIL